MFTVIWLVVISVVIRKSECGCENVQTARQDALSIRSLELDFKTRFTWQATRGTSDFIIEYGDALTLTVEQPGERKLRVSTGGSKGEASLLSACRKVTATAACVLATILILNYKNTLLLITTLLCLFASILAQPPNCEQSDFIHLLIPSAFINQVCQNDECWPVLCKLNPFSEYSDIPSNNDLVFLDNQCTIRMPEDWQLWLDQYFGPGSTREYYGDEDSDGLVNILEYYGSAAFNDTFTILDDLNGTESTNKRRNKRNSFVDKFDGTDPTKSDTDGDLLQDGFEVMNSMNPVIADDTQGDYDGDSLDNLNEQIHRTDPRNPDSDGDGVSDGQEVSNGGNPNNPADKGQQPTDIPQALVLLTVGDHSGSHSERYVLHVGPISHQSPGFGLVGSGTYNFEPGTYSITLQHAGSNQNEPDYDYTALVSKVGGEAKVVIEDPQGMLGVHTESRPFFAAGKSATMKVEHECFEDGEQTPDCRCTAYKRCVDCKADEECKWSVKGKSCSASHWYDLPWGSVSGDDQCDCEKCQTWYDEERQDTSWLEELNRMIPCPCTVTVGADDLIPPNADNWDSDFWCSHNGGPNCADYHPGANGCIRSSENTPAGARQQCCYGNDGNILTPGSPGAGTPDRSGSFWQHLKVDVDTYEWCCDYCEEENSCQRYMELRMGDISHCNK